MLSHIPHIPKMVALTALTLVTVACDRPPVEPAAMAQTPVVSTPTCVPPLPNTPFPTLTPWPTYTPAPTLPPAPPSGVEFIIPDVRDAELARRINSYRVAHGQSELSLSYVLAYIAAAKVHLAMISSDAPKALAERDMLPNYSWAWVAFRGDTDAALSLNSAQAAFEHLQRDHSANILSPDHRELGAAWLCNQRVCAYHVVLGHNR